MISTFKVGDTINAKYAPENATNPKYAWFVGDSATQVETPILDATTASFSVTEAYVGKFIKVTVTGVDGAAVSATTTAAVTAAPTDKIAIVSAKQTGAAKIEATFNKPVSTSEWDITVSRGTTVQADPTIVLNETATTAIITLGTAMSSSEYTVKIVNKSDATENAQSTFSAEAAALTAIDFVGDQLILTSSDMKKASVNISGKNQFDEDVALSGALTVYSTKGKADYSQADKKIVITCEGNTIFFTTGEQVTVTAVYNNGNVPLQVSKALTVSNVATLTEFELGEIASTRASLKDKPINLTNLATDTYYYPVKTAKDQYGNDLTAKELDTMMVKGAADASKNLYITPNQADGSYAYVTGFSALDDGTIAMNISKGSLDSPGKALFSMTGVSGYQGTQELEIVDDPFIAELDVIAPNLYVGKEVELTVTAKDQYGSEINLYDVGAELASTGVGVKFKDKNHLTKGNSSITFSDASATVKIKKNTSKKTMSFLYTPGTKDQTIVTVQTATPFANNLTWTVAATPNPAGISGLADGIKTEVTIGSGNIVNLADETKLVWLDESGAKMTAGFPTYAATATTTDMTADGFYYTVGAPSNTKVITNTSGQIATQSDSTASTGTATVKVTLYQVKDSSTTAKITSLAEKTFKFTVAGDTYKSYKATLAKGSELLYVNKKSADFAAFTVVGVDENGYEVEVSDYTVTVDSDLVVSGLTVSGKVDGITAAGTAVATIWDVVDGTTQAVATVDIPYDVAAPTPQKDATYLGTKSVTDTEFEGVTAVEIIDDGTVDITNAKGTYTAEIDDQYNLPMANTAWAIDGVALKAGNIVDGKQHVITATSGKVSGSWTIQGAAITITAPVDTAKTLSAAKWTAGANTATITYGTAAGEMGRFTLSDNEGTTITDAYDKVTVQIANALGEDKTSFFTVAKATNDIKIDNKATTPVGIYTVTFTATEAVKATLKGSVTASQKLTVNPDGVLGLNTISAFAVPTASVAANTQIATLSGTTGIAAGTTYWLEQASSNSSATTGWTAVSNGQLTVDGTAIKTGASAPALKADTYYRIKCQTADAGKAADEYWYCAATPTETVGSGDKTAAAKMTTVEGISTASAVAFATTTGTAVGATMAGVTVKDQFGNLIKGGTNLLSTPSATLTTSITSLSSGSMAVGTTDDGVMIIQTDPAPNGDGTLTLTKSGDGSLVVTVGDTHTTFKVTSWTP